MRALLFVAHPRTDSFTHAAAEAVHRGLEHAGHDVDVIDLYAVGSATAMSRDERAAYHGDEPLVDELAERHAELVRRADCLAFVYPTWWSGLPAVLKGWLERVMVPGVAFGFDERTGKVRPGLQHVRRIVGVSTYGSPHAYVSVVNDNGRRILARALRSCTGWRTRTTWLACYGIDTATDEERAAFLARVERRTAALR